MPQFFAALIPGVLGGEGRDTGKQGIVRAFAVSDPANVSIITLSPLPNSGFTVNRSAFCPQSTTVTLQSPIFCPDVNAAPTSTTITAAPQGVYPNQLQSALIRGNRLFLPEHRCPA